MRVQYRRDLRLALQLAADGALEDLFAADPVGLAADLRAQSNALHDDPMAQAFLAVCGSPGAPADTARGLLESTTPGTVPQRRLRVLFICSRNQWRSPTAEALWARDPSLDVRSAGTARSARRRARAADLDWADLVLVMERSHQHRLRQDLPGPVADVEVVVLDIPDEFPFMDPELVTLLRQAVPSALAAYRERMRCGLT